MGMEAIGGVLKRNSLKWLNWSRGEEDEKDWARKCMYMEVDQQGQKRGQGRLGWKIELDRNSVLVSVSGPKPAYLHFQFWFR